MKTLQCLILMKTWTDIRKWQQTKLFWESCKQTRGKVAAFVSHRWVLFVQKNDMDCGQAWMAGREWSAGQGKKVPHPQNSQVKKEEVITNHVLLFAYIISNNTVVFKSFCCVQGPLFFCCLIVPELQFSLNAECIYDFCGALRLYCGASYM